MAFGIGTQVIRQLREFAELAGVYIGSRGTAGEVNESARAQLATADFFRSFPIFSGEAYRRLNPDLARSIDPFWHASEYGLYEGRPLFEAAAIETALGSLDWEGSSQTEDFTSKHSLAGSQFLVLVSSLGNFFMRELAERLASDLRLAGAKVELANEKMNPARVKSNKTVVIVAPHEFFLLGRGGHVWRRALGKVGFYALNTEQPQTPWFNQCFKYLLLAKGVIDLSPQTASIFSRMGVKACHYVPSFSLSDAPYDSFVPAQHPLLKAYPDLLGVARNTDALLSARPLDVSFIGGPSPRRERFFGESASLLSRWRCLIDYRKNLRGPIQWGRNNRHEIGFGHFLARHSKVYLNVHRDQFGFFEVHRMVMQGMANGAAVVTDQCMKHPDFSIGVHYMQDDLHQIPKLIDWLLGSPEGRQKCDEVARAGYEAYRDKWSSERTTNVLSGLFRTGEG